MVGRLDRYWSRQFLGRYGSKVRSQGVLQMKRRLSPALVFLPASYVIALAIILVLFREPVLDAFANDSPLWYLLLTIHFLVALIWLYVLITLSVHVWSNRFLAAPAKALWL